LRLGSYFATFPRNADSVSLHLIATCCNSCLKAGLCMWTSLTRTRAVSRLSREATRPRYFDAEP
jgi:hypothetical protein